MALSQRLEIRQGQALVMTPQLMQAIKLLQLSSLDLVAYVDAELERNPLLDHAAAEGDGETVAAEAERSDAEPAENGDARDGDWMGESPETSRAAIEERLDTNLENVFPDSDEPQARAPASDLPPVSEWASVGAGGRDNPDYNIEAFISSEPTLADHLAEQLALAALTPPQRLIGAFLIDLVDEAGYIGGDLDVVADKLGASAHDVDGVLKVIQAFDPPGICARNLAECLAIQLRERDRFDPAMQALIGHIELLAKRDF